MELSIKLNDEYKVNFAPATREEEIKQNVRTLFSVYAGSVPLARNMGVPSEVIDTTLPVLRAKIPIIYTDLLVEYEPRASLKEVIFEQDLTGKVQQLVRVAIQDE